MCGRIPRITVYQINSLGSSFSLEIVAASIVLLCVCFVGSIQPTASLLSYSSVLHSLVDCSIGDSTSVGLHIIISASSNIHHRLGSKESHFDSVDCYFSDSKFRIPSKLQTSFFLFQYRYLELESVTLNQTSRFINCLRAWASHCCICLHILAIVVCIYFLKQVFLPNSGRYLNRQSP